MQEFNLAQTINVLKGPPKEQIIVNNYWAAVGFDRYHQNSAAEIEFILDGKTSKVKLSWNSNFSKAAMKEDKDIANFGGVALAWFIMSVMFDFKYVEQTEIGDGVDYRFRMEEPDDDDLNFMDDFHHVEVSGILEESKTNTLKARIKTKHQQIDRGGKRDMPSSVLVTLFSQPKTVKEIHNEA
jgi:hypothetical protein